MDEAGLWRLFFLTGLPEAWLALRGEAQAHKEEQPQAMTAFAADPRREAQC